MPPSRLAPWQVVQPAEPKTWAPFVALPGRALVLPDAAGLGEDDSADTAVSVHPARTAGTRTAMAAESFQRLPRMSPSR